MGGVWLRGLLRSGWILMCRLFDRLGFWVLGMGFVLWTWVRMWPNNWA